MNIFQSYFTFLKKLLFTSHFTGRRYDFFPSINNNKIFNVISTLLFTLITFPAVADVNNGDTAWILMSTALVLFMTLPALTLFYAGLANSKNVVSVLMQHFSFACLVSVIWVI